MQSRILNTEKDPMGQMLLSFLGGEAHAFLDVRSPDFEMSEMTGQMLCRTQWGTLESIALNACEGRVLDVGAGGGCHSLWLQSRGMAVTALDISPGCVAAMENQGVERVVHAALAEVKDQRYDTLLLLMNGIGICGNHRGMDRFFHGLSRFLLPGGQLLVDSTDLSVLPGYDAQSRGETCFQMSFEGIVGDYFDWLYVDYPTLEAAARSHGFSCECLHSDGTSGQFLARIFSKHHI